MMASAKVDVRTRSSSSADENSKQSEQGRQSTSPMASAAETSSRPPPSPSPDTAKCAICLGDLQDKCTSNTCCHEFCYGCLVKWSEVKPECPLCKSTFQSIYYNIRSITEFEEYIVPVNPAPPMPHLSLRINTDNYAPPEVIIRSRGNVHDYSIPHFRIGGRSSASHSFTRDPRYISIMQIGFNAPRSMLMQPEAIDLTLQGTMIPNDNPFYSETPELFGRALDIANGMLSSSNPHFSGYQMRRRRYDRVQWVRPFDSALNPGASVFPSVEYFQRTGSAMRRIAPWLHRELTVLLSLRHSRTEMAHVYDVIVSLLRRCDIRSMEFREHVRSYFGNNTRQFQHEFFHFVLSGYSMEEYDRVAAYRDSAPLFSPTVPVTNAAPPVVTIDSDDDTEPAVNAQNTQANRPNSGSTHGISGRDPGLEIVISDDDDGPPTLYPQVPHRRRSPPLSPALNEEEYHMLSDMLEGPVSRLNRSDRRGTAHRSMSPATEEFLGALDPFDLSDPPLNHQNDLLDFDYEVTRPHSTIDLNNLSSSSNSTRARPPSSRNSSTNAAAPSSDTGSSLSEALMRFVDSNPLSSTTPREARERASATIDMIAMLQRRTAASRRVRANIHDPVDGRQNPRPPRHPTLFDEPQRPPRSSGRRTQEPRRALDDTIWPYHTLETEDRVDSRPPSSNRLPADAVQNEESDRMREPAFSDSENMAGCSSVQIRIFPPAMDLSSRTSAPSVSPYSRPYSSSVIQSRSGTINLPSNAVHHQPTNAEPIASSSRRTPNTENLPDEDECEFLGVQPVYKKPPLAVITLSSDDDDDEGDSNERNRPKFEEQQGSSTRDPYEELLRACGVYPSTSRANISSNVELSSLPTENMVERHLDAVASGFAYPMSMSSYPENQRPVQSRDERLSSDSEGGLGGSDQVPSTSSLFRSYQVYPSSENNGCDPRSNSAQSSSVDFDLLSIPRSSSSSDRDINIKTKVSTKSKHKKIGPTNEMSKLSKQKKVDKRKRASTFEEFSDPTAGPSSRLTKGKQEKKEKVNCKRKVSDKYKRIRHQTGSTDEEDNESQTRERFENSSVTPNPNEQNSPMGNLCLPVLSDLELPEAEETTPNKRKKPKKTKVKKSRSKPKSSKKEKKDGLSRMKSKAIPAAMGSDTSTRAVVGSSNTSNKTKKLKSVVVKVDKKGSQKKFTLLSDSSSEESGAESKIWKDKRLRSVINAPSGSTISSSSSTLAALGGAHSSSSSSFSDLKKSGQSSNCSSSNLDGTYGVPSEAFPLVPRKKLLRRWESEDDENHTKEVDQMSGLPDNQDFAYSSTSSDEDDDNKIQRRNDSDEDDTDLGSNSRAKRSRLYLF